MGTATYRPLPDLADERVSSCGSSLTLLTRSTTVAGAMTQTPDASKTSHLGAAKAAKNDEFYTTWADIEREMNAY